MGATIAERNLAAEARFVEEGHRAFVQPGGSVRVVSDTHPGKTYRVTFRAIFAGDPIVFSCEPEGRAAYRDDHQATTGSPGLCPCKHAAGAARRLEREGLAELDPRGLWRVTEAARTPYRPDPSTDPFAGLS